jgi:hypothetical protein
VSRTYAKKATLNLRATGVCAMANPTERGWYKKAWDVIWKSTLEKVWLFLLPLLLGWLVQRWHKMPTAIEYPAQYWLGLASLMVATYAVILSLAKIGVWFVKQARGWIYPPSLKIVGHAGEKASVEFTHSGITAIWEAHIRILRTLDEYPNPKSILQQSYLHKDGKSFRSLQLSDGELSNITLAELYWPSYGSGPSVVVPTAD